MADLDDTRVCTRCNAEKPLTEFRKFKEKRVRRGWAYQTKCWECERDIGRTRAKSRTTAQRQKERARIAARKGCQYRPGKPPHKITDAAWDRVAEQNAGQAWRHWMKVAPDEWVAAYWEAKGEPWRNRRLTDAERFRLRYRLDLSFQIKQRIRRQITKARKRDGIADVMRSALVKDYRSPTIERVLGYAIADLRKHIERQFTQGMSWDAYRAGRIHIDHIHPISSFDMSDDEQFKACWELSNLRPMWAQDNLKKRARVETLL